MLNSHHVERETKNIIELMQKFSCFQSLKIVILYLIFYSLIYLFKSKNIAHYLDNVLFVIRRRKKTL